MTHPQLQRAAAEWRGNRRLRLGALAVLAILGTQAALALSDARQAREAAYARDEQLLGRLEEASREAAWPARAKAAEAALAQTRHAIPPARSDGLAQAEMQAWLTDLAAYAGVAGPAVRVETSLPVPGQPGIWQVLARLDGQASPAVVPVFVRALASALPWVRTERLEVAAGDNGRVSVVVRGYYRQGDALDARTPPPRPAALPPASESAPVAPAQPRNPLASLAAAARQQAQEARPADSRPAPGVASPASGAARRARAPRPATGNRPAPARRQRPEKTR